MFFPYQQQERSGSFGRGGHSFMERISLHVWIPPPFFFRHAPFMLPIRGLVGTATFFKNLSYFIFIFIFIFNFHRCKHVLGMDSKVLKVNSKLKNKEFSERTCNLKITELEDSCYCQHKYISHFLSMMIILIVLTSAISHQQIPLYISPTSVSFFLLCFLFFRYHSVNLQDVAEKLKLSYSVLTTCVETTQNYMFNDFPF